MSIDTFIVHALVTLAAAFALGALELALERKRGTE